MVNFAVVSGHSWSETTDISIPPTTDNYLQRQNPVEILKPFCRTVCLLREGPAADPSFYGSCPKKTQGTRESGSFGTVAHFCYALKMEKSPAISRTRSVYFNP
jgi:hypothetical protein